MRKTYRMAAAAAACAAGVAAILMILWPAWPTVSGGLLPWDAAAWRPVLVDSDGRAVAMPGRAFLLIAVTVLLAITLVSVTLSVLVRVEYKEIEVPAPGKSSELDVQVSGEVAKLLQMVRGHLEANGAYGDTLAKISEQLPSIATQEQMRMVVSYLILENENMRKKSANLQANLESSKKLIDHLKNNLAAAKVEVLSDSLTGVKNRRAFDLTLAGELAEARGNARPLSLIMADIDHFKAVNDRFGHQTGDEVLRWFAQMLSRNVKGRDCVARYGGEEFVIVLPETPLDAAMRLATHIKAEIEQRQLTLPGPPAPAINITASFGIAQWKDGETTDNFIKRADAKLYDAKSAGRNHVAA